MAFRTMGRLSTRMRQIVGIADCPTGRGNFGGNQWGLSGVVVQKCELPFGTVSGISPGAGVLDGVDILQREGKVWVFSGPLGAFWIHWL